MNYTYVGEVISNLIDNINVYSGSAEVERAYEDFRNDLTDIIDVAIDEFEDGEYDFQDILTDEAATEIGKAIIQSLYNVSMERLR